MNVNVVCFFKTAKSKISDKWCLDRQTKKLDHTGSNGTKWDQLGPNGTKWDLMEPNWTKWDEMGQNGTKWDEMGQTVFSVTWILREINHNLEMVEVEK